MKIMMDGAVITGRVAEGLDSLQMDACATLDVIDHAMRMIVAGGTELPDNHQETVLMLRDLVILRSDLELVCGYNDPEFDDDDYQDLTMGYEDEEEDLDDEEYAPDPEQSETGSEPDTGSEPESEPEPESGD